MGEEISADEEIEYMRRMVCAENIRKFAKWLEFMYLSRRDILYRLICSMMKTTQTTIRDESINNETRKLDAKHQKCAGIFGASVWMGDGKRQKRKKNDDHNNILLNANMIVFPHV